MTAQSNKRFTLSLSKGFTLIELLIVIAVLGILAVAVLSAINPIEQINRSRDTGSRSDSEQLINAMDRYYTTKGYYVWQSGATDVANLALAWQPVSDAWVDSVAVPILVGATAKLSSGGTAEVKQSYTDRITDATYNTMYVYNGGAQGDSTYVCFAPKSGAFTTEGDDRCAGGVPDDFPAEACNNANDECGAGTNCVCLP